MTSPDRSGYDRVTLVRDDTDSEWAVLPLALKSSAWGEAREWCEFVPLAALEAAEREARDRAIRDVVEALRSEEAFTDVAGRKPGIGRVRIPDPESCPICSAIPKLRAIASGGSPLSEAMRDALTDALVDYDVPTSKIVQEFQRLYAEYAAYTDLGEDNCDAVRAALRAAYRIDGSRDE